MCSGIEFCGVEFDATAAFAFEEKIESQLSGGGAQALAPVFFASEKDADACIAALVSLEKGEADESQQMFQAVADGQHIGSSRVHFGKIGFPHAQNLLVILIGAESQSQDLGVFQPSRDFDQVVAAQRTHQQAAVVTSHRPFRRFSEQTQHLERFPFEMGMPGEESEWLASTRKACADPEQPCRVSHSSSSVSSSEEVASTANQLILQGDVEGALALFRTHLVESPFDPRVGELVDSLLLVPDQGRGLVDFYRELQREHPNDWRLLVCLARAYSKTGKDSLAVVQLQKLLRGEDQRVEVWMELATCYKRLDKLELALRALNSLIDLQSDYAPAHVARVRYLVEANDLAEAVAATIFSLEIKGLEAPVRDWLDKINLALEQGQRPDDELLNRSI